MRRVHFPVFSELTTRGRLGRAVLGVGLTVFLAVTASASYDTYYIDNATQQPVHYTVPSWAEIDSIAFTPGQTAYLKITTKGPIPVDSAETLGPFMFEVYFSRDRLVAFSLNTEYPAAGYRAGMVAMVVDVKTGTVLTEANARVDGNDIWITFDGRLVNSGPMNAYCRYLPSAKVFESQPLETSISSYWEAVPRAVPYQTAIPRFARPKEKPLVAASCSATVYALCAARTVGGLAGASVR